MKKTISCAIILHVGALAVHFYSMEYDTVIIKHENDILQLNSHRSLEVNHPNPGPTGDTGTYRFNS